MNKLTPTYYTFPFKSKNELISFYHFLMPQFYIIDHPDQDIMIKEIIDRLLNQISGKINKFKKSSTVKFTPGEVAAVKFLYNYLPPVFTDPSWIMGMRVRNELIRQQSSN